MAMGKLNPPLVENKTIAQVNPKGITIYFTMNKSVGWADFTSIKLILKSVQSNQILKTLTCSKSALTVENNVYKAFFQDGNKDLGMLIGQYYKAQLSYVNVDGIDGFYSNITTFKFTKKPSVSIKNLTTSGKKYNIHTYTYTGNYTNEKDSNEKVYSYCFNIYDGSGDLIVSSGEQLHNSSTDTSTTSSEDTWTTRYGLSPGVDYYISYEITTINGFKKSSPRYKIMDGQTVPSNIFKYCNFVAINNSESACVELSIQPKKNLTSLSRKLINGQFILLRASSEDNFQSWHELTRFILASWDSGQEKFLCKDYSVSQGVTYRYGLQAFNNQGLYSVRETAPDVEVDFEDLFLSDGKRQLRVKFNPKVSSIKNTILESKMDTLGGKYPFFFRNGNVKYKEFPISGLISMLMDENSEFMNGIQAPPKERLSTPAKEKGNLDLSTWLTGENFRKERTFKMEVLEWLTNGEPKLFRSPGEGSYIVRLMNTSLSPNDTLGRMLHTFSCTAYEIADFTFENLRNYGMMMDEYTETRVLRFVQKNLKEAPDGILSGLNACMATVHANPTTSFYYRLEKDKARTEVVVGSTGIYTFPAEVLADNPLIEIGSSLGSEGWGTSSMIIYGTYAHQQTDEFSYIHSIDIKDRIAQWIGRNRKEIPSRFKSKELVTSVGLVYYLNIQKRDIITVTSVKEIGDDQYDFYLHGMLYQVGSTDILYNSSDKMYYDGRTRGLIGNASKLDFTFTLREGEDSIDMRGVEGIESGLLPIIDGCDHVVSTGGRLVLNNVRDIDSLRLGNGLYADIAYQEINKVYTVETVDGHPVKIAKDKWLSTKNPNDFTAYYNALKEVLQEVEEGLIIDAI